MRVFLAGATGAVGRQLVPLLVSAGHQVTAATRTSGKLRLLRALGADAVVVNGLDKQAVRRAVTSSRADAIIHQMTALASVRNLKKFDQEFAFTNRLRTEGTRHLLDAAHAAGTRIFVAQSYTGWPNERGGSRVKSEDDPLDPRPPKTMFRTLAAIRELEYVVSHAAGITAIALRYGSLYGPGTSISQDGEFVHLIRPRKFPLIGNGAGVWSFLHVHDAAAAAMAALERATPGIYNIVDDEPAEVSVWLPFLAHTLGARPPHHLPAWIARFVVGDAVVSMMTRMRGSSNEKAKRLLGWRPDYPSWREGFRQALSLSPSQTYYSKAS